MAIGQQLSRGSDDGVCVGQSITDKIGFYGLATPIVQPSGTSQAAYTKTTTTTTTTTALTVDITALAVLVNKMRTDLIALGLIKGSA